MLQYIENIGDIMLQLSLGSAATNPVVWGMLQHPVRNILKLHACGTSKPDEIQADSWPFQMKSTLVVFAEL